MASAPYRSASASTASAQPSGRQRSADDLGRGGGVVVDPRSRQCHVPGAGPEGGRRGEVGRPGHPRRARHHPHRGLPLVPGRPPMGQDRERRRPPRRGGSGPSTRRDRCRPPRPPPPSSAPGDSRRPGLSAAKVTVRVAAHRGATDGASQAVDPRGDVDGENRSVAPGRRPLPPEPGAEGRVDDQIGRTAARRGVRPRPRPRPEPPAGAGGGRRRGRRCRCCPCRRRPPPGGRRCRPSAGPRHGPPHSPPDR